MSSIIFSGASPLGPTVARNLQGNVSIVYSYHKSREEALETCRRLSRDYGVECKVVDAGENTVRVTRIDPDSIDLISKGYRFIVLIVLPKTPY